MNGWYVVRTKTGSEDRAVWHLENQGFHTYLPRYAKQVRHARKTRTVHCPLFPGYVFVRLNLETQRWRAINSTIGVIGMVQFGALPCLLADEMIRTIRARENEAGIVDLAPQDLKKGDRVVVHEGAFADYTAVLAEDCDKRRVMILLDLMGREVRVNISLENLAKAS